MSEESICLYDLLNLAIGTRQRGTVNFNALHALLLAVLRQLDIRDVKTQWRDSPPGDRQLAYLVEVNEPKQPQRRYEQRPRYQSDEDDSEEESEDDPEDELKAEPSEARAEPRGERRGEQTAEARAEQKAEPSESKGERRAEQKAEPGERRAEPKGEPSEPKGERRAEPSEPKGERRAEPKGERRAEPSEPKGERRAEPKGERRAEPSEPKGERRAEPKGERRAEPSEQRGERRAEPSEPKGERRAEPSEQRGERRAEPIVERRAEPSEPKGERRGEQRAEPTVEQKSDPRAESKGDDPRAETRSEPRAESGGEQRAEPKHGSKTGSRTGSKTGSRTGSKTGPKTGRKTEEPKFDPEAELFKARSLNPFPTPASGTMGDELWRLFSRFQACEDGVSKAMKLIQKLQDDKDNLQEEIRDHQKFVSEQVELVTVVEKCCHRVEALEEIVGSLRDTFQKYPDPEELSQYVTWNIMQSDLLSKTASLSKDAVNRDSPTFGEALREDPRPATEPYSVTPQSPQPTHLESDLSEAAMPISLDASSLEHYSEAMDGASNIGRVKESLDNLATHLIEVEEGKVDQTELIYLREFIANTVSQDVANYLMDRLNQQRALLENQMGERENLGGLLQMVQQYGPTHPERESTPEGAPQNVDSDRQLHEHGQQIFYLRRSVQKLEEDVKQLRAKQASMEKRVTDLQLQDQLDDLRGMLDDMMLTLTSELSSSLEDELDESDSHGLGENTERSAFVTRTVIIGRKLSCLFQCYEQLQDTVNSLLQQQTGGDRAEPVEKRQNVELVNDVQKAILELQAECEKLQETTMYLHEDNRQKQSHIEELYKTMEELEEKKADKQMVESEIKADKSALESKVSRLQFDSATEQLNTMFHELLNKVIGHEQDWHKVMDKLSTEMQCKLNRIELDSVKKQLEDRWKTIHQKLQAQGAPDQEDAAGLRKQLVDRFHCLSCDRPVVKQTPGPHLMTLPCTPALAPHKSFRPFTVYTLEQFRQHYRGLRPGTNRYNYEAAASRRMRARLQRNHAVMCKQAENMQERLKHWESTGSHDSAKDSLKQNQPGVQHERIAELKDYGHLSVSRSCGGSHTITSASQRRSGLQYIKHHSQTEVDGIIRSEEVNILGRDGHVYKGRLASRITETKLPAISSKDAGLCKTKDKPRASPSHKPNASPEMGLNPLVPLPHSARSAQCRSISSISGQDWPVSALGCASQNSMISAAEESNSEPLDNQQVSL